MDKNSIPTPAMLLDLHLFNRNIRRMAQFFDHRPAKLRPHFKAHRCLEIARRQCASGAIGITCSSIWDAASLVNHGMDHVLVANEIASDEKLACAARLCRERKDVIVGVDNLTLARTMDRVGFANGTRLNVLLDVNVGMNRCGLVPGTELSRLAHFCSQARGLCFRGVMGYEGHVAGGPRSAGKAARIRKALSVLTRVADDLRKDGIPVGIVSAGGSSTYWATGEFPGVTEVQAGSYFAMEPSLVGTGVDFSLAATVLTTIISTPRKGYAIGDAGRKAFHPSHGMPVPKSLKGAVVEQLHAEHCIINLSAQKRHPRVGQKIECFVPYVDGTFNLYDRIYVVHKGKVEGIWDILPRNPGGEAIPSRNATSAMM